jgi:hypothetical protein
MTSRRRAATFTFSPETDGDGKDNRAADLERKLEMLEARFTMPLNFQVHHQQNNSNNSNSPATLDAENSSPVSVQSSTVRERSHQNRNDSQQSFTFDTPSLLNVNDNSRKQSKGCVDINSQSNGIGVKLVPHRWEEIAAAHVARVQLMHESIDSQQNTLQTSHVKDHSSSTSPVRTTFLAEDIERSEGIRKVGKTAHEPSSPFIASPPLKNQSNAMNVLVRRTEWFLLCLLFTRICSHFPLN